MKAIATILFHDELNDFLAAEAQMDHVRIAFQQSSSVKDVIESQGIPHTEVGLILVNHVSVSFDYSVQNDDRIDVFPACGIPDITDAIILQPPEPESFRFVLDTHLGRLASYLRMLGFDALYRNDFADPELADISANQKRILLTCDRYLLMRKIVAYGYFVRSRQPKKQVSEVLGRYNLFDRIKPFSRCIRCNGLVKPIDKQKIENRLMPETRRWYSEFWQCTDCGHVYWKGSHYDRMQKLITTLTANK